jgi:hypothetical protein
MPFTITVGASNISQLRIEWIWQKPQGTGFLNANRYPLKCGRRGNGVRHCGQRQCRRSGAWIFGTSAFDIAKSRMKDIEQGIFIRANCAQIKGGSEVEP